MPQILESWPRAFADLHAGKSMGTQFREHASGHGQKPRDVFLNDCRFLGTDPGVDYTEAIAKFLR